MINVQITMIVTATLAVGCTAMFLYKKQIGWYLISSVLWAVFILLSIHVGLPP